MDLLHGILYSLNQVTAGIESSIDVGKRDKSS